MTTIPASSLDADTVGSLDVDLDMVYYGKQRVLLQDKSTNMYTISTTARESVGGAQSLAPLKSSHTRYLESDQSFLIPTIHRHQQLLKSFGLSLPEQHTVELTSRTKLNQVAQASNPIEGCIATSGE